ncbi:HipA N-terminal domain-containing protein [Vibrio gazogenes]|uniref:HipA N-terminal domain-containing protein n=1 Tax=Vibrio gazogenes TaxID=687 RepID=UPI002FCBA4FF
MANRSGVPYSTIRKFENSGNISLRQFLMLFEAVGDIGQIRSNAAKSTAPHDGLHGVFADSLPDGWGLYLMDRVFKKHGYPPHLITALERLTYIGEQCEIPPRLSDALIQSHSQH